MSDTVENQEPKEKEPTEAELREYRENMKKFYEGEIALLRRQKEYEALLADIEESRLKRLTMTMRIAQIMAGPPKEPDAKTPPPDEKERPVRQLKKEEV